jgi:hypothetical protein
MTPESNVVRSWPELRITTRALHRPAAMVNGVPTPSASIVGEFVPNNRMDLLITTRSWKTRVLHQNGVSVLGL